jgi:hypothetical protein
MVKGQGGDDGMTLFWQWNGAVVTMQWDSESEAMVEW